MREAPDRELISHAGKRARPVVHPIPPVWDVLASCDIAGASDSSIRNAVPNDFTPMLAESHIGRVLCTGRTAYALWRRHCAGKYEEAFHLTAECLPSTSPANAAFPLERFAEIYRAAIRSQDQASRTKPSGLTFR